MSWRQVQIAALAFLATGAARAADEDTDGAKPAGQGHTQGLVELKRQATARGTPEETTKTNLKFDYFPQDGMVSLLRLELPFPDEKTSFEGGNPAFGDVQIRDGHWRCWPGASCGARVFPAPTRRGRRSRSSIAIEANRSTRPAAGPSYADPVGLAAAVRPWNSSMTSATEILRPK